jgi:hypothetical protein
MSTDEGVASLGARVYNGSPLAVECFERVSISSFVGGPVIILNLSATGKRVRTSILAMQSCISSAHL